MIIEDISRDAVLLISSCLAYGAESALNSEQKERGRSLWQHIQIEFQKYEFTKNLIEDIKTRPTDEIVNAIFRHQLSTRMKTDSDFAFNVEHLLYVQKFKQASKVVLKSQTNRLPSKVDREETHVSIGG